MDRLHNYVEQLFIKYKGSKQVQELKQEVLSNLEAKVADLTANGMDEGEAVRVAKDGIITIDDLIDSNRKVYINQWRLELVQIGLLYFLIAWIIALPFRIIGSGILLNELLSFITFILGISYLVLRTRKQALYLRQTATLDLQAAFYRRKLGWVIWSIFIGVMVLYTTAIHFGSNIWFSRPATFSGPYQFAVVAIAYVQPFFSILVPLLLHAMPKLIMKYEVGEEDDYEA
ncbi:permease prefix domain 1-containing protein [Brevibacillus sp. NRS-1366]|uniref:permease prefix domain 1-containing protein n=1 Tax=Brevibacillus sp. NRS-1366 TaxID=3233899 RepID=UPI003D19B6B7